MGFLEGTGHHVEMILTQKSSVYTTTDRGYQAGFCEELFLDDQCVRDAHALTFGKYDQGIDVQFYHVVFKIDG